MLQPAPGRRFPSNSPHPVWLLVGMAVLTVGVVAAAVGLTLQHAAAHQSDAFHFASASAASTTNRALFIVSIWIWSGTLTAAAGAVILVLTLRKQSR